jgi:uncharacterized membrane protein (Fun14 family)
VIKRRGFDPVSLSEYPLWLNFAASLIVILGAGEFGRVLALRLKDERKEGIARLHATTNALFALMVGFSFATGLTRFEERREAALSEANSIAAAGFYARLLPAPYNSDILNLLRDYAQIQLDVAQDPNIRLSTTILSRFNSIEDALWQQTIMAREPGGTDTTVGFIRSLSEMANNREKDLIAVSTQMPDIVLISLYGIAFVVSFCSGYANGSESSPSRAVVAMVGVLLCSLILLIQDLDRPMAGIIAVNRQPFVDVSERLSSYAEQIFRKSGSIR